MDDHHHPQPLQQQLLLRQAQGLSLSLPLHPPSAAPLAEGAVGGHNRDDCWSEGGTATLIEAWGERYLQLNRGNLKQKHWQDVADAVNGRRTGTKAPKTDVQCKNRLDTLKKKYKVEKSRSDSKWQFFLKLDQLIGPPKKGMGSSGSGAGAPKRNPLPQQQPIAAKTKLLQRHVSVDPDTKPFINHSSNLSNSKSENITESCPYSAADGIYIRNSVKRKMQDSPFKDLTRAILKFSEVYERIEGSKQQQLVELEKQRMEFAKDVELQRMQLYMQTQVELAKLKQSKRGSTEHYL
ncbi:hypothetical protein O6H91_17G088300 [Diphasiastrum complanatum]|uniref:Uncharacterized protein n=1 Tax=Diphasiastrum complanatum TaxID=34168 RepID=A0ACC2B8Z2_DIPCM|nr:hypothetical protein O6H91_Y075400 [Diphasiastrum complanatum]KAJ7526214.1 hypothetical protein O6H91_17G088300 [Diphasiastrum complanatum]